MSGNRRGKLLSPRNCYLAGFFQVPSAAYAGQIRKAFEGLTRLLHAPMKVAHCTEYDSKLLHSDMLASKH